MRYIPDDNLSYPIQLTLDDNSSGSGFYLNYQGKELYIVTARHVLYKEENSSLIIKSKKIKILSYDKDISILMPYISELDLLTLPSQNLKFSQTHDVAIIKIGDLTKVSEVSFQIKSEPSLTYLEGPIGHTSGLVNIDSNRFKKYEETLISNEVIIFGYPVSLGTGKEIDYKRPLLRKGIIAGKNINNRTIILDCPAYQGNSGGLVLELEPGTRETHPIGIVSAFVPFYEVFKSVHFNYNTQSLENSGYSIITPIDVITELINS